jgi:hypothetical protein
MSEMHKHTGLRNVFSHPCFDVDCDRVDFSQSGANIRPSTCDYDVAKRERTRKRETRWISANLRSLNDQNGLR